MLNALDIHVTGIVQGVGFRPFVYRLAKRYLVNGWVLNAVDGVHIHAEGEEQLVDEFIMEMHDNPPAAASIKRIDMKEVPLEGFESFEIRFSDSDEVEETTLVSPDLATCEDCVAELFDPADRRFHYPFINCTNCGPRFTIIDALPYDRAGTSMAGFAMCDTCAAEYADPADRRFHAQPDACFECGPHLCLAMLEGVSKGSDTPCDPAVGGGGDAVPSEGPCAAGACALVRSGSSLPSNEIASQSSRNGVSKPSDGTPTPPPRDPAVAGGGDAIPSEGPCAAGACALVRCGRSEGPRFEWGLTREESDALVTRTVDLLHAGKIVAVKGLGGFHLVCDASNAETLAELRRRKRREGKAFAVMVADVDAARAYCSVSLEEEALLKAASRPIVLLRKLPDVQLATGLADALSELGVMLPATPLQHLIVRAFGGMLVFTSGNLHDEPIQIDDVEACRTLSGIADALLGNDRPIRSRYDDSVVRVLKWGNESAVQMIRRARGYAPLPIAVSTSAGCSAAVFATGPEQKNTFCFLDGSRAFVSQHIGDMENAETFDAWLEAKACYERLFELSPAMAACDMHPEYLTSKWAAEQGMSVVRVQHHHAHVVSAMVENGLEGPVLGFAFDGTGAGADGVIWGGEVLLANLSSYERFANFAYFPLPGGAAAIKHPLRCAYGALWAFDLLEHPAAARVLDALADEAAVCERMIEAGLNTPYTSSVGRLFDAASAILGLCDTALYEGEPAILLEAVLSHNAGAHEGAADTVGDRSAAYHIDIVKNTATESSTALDTSVVLLDAEPLFRALLDDLGAGVPVCVIAQRFHDAFVDAIVQVAQLGQLAYGIGTAVLSGGVFMNRYLCEHAVPALVDAGITVAMNRELPPNDGCISLGQAVVALQQPAD